MHILYEKADRLSELVLAAAIEVHRDKGPGLLESIYERCLVHEFRLRRITAISQKLVPITHKDLVFDEVLRFDLLVEECLLLELKAVEKILPIHKAQIFSYMKLMDIPLGLILNFHDSVIRHGIARIILPGANLL